MLDVPARHYNDGIIYKTGAGARVRVGVGRAIKVEVDDLPAGIFVPLTEAIDVQIYRQVFLSPSPRPLMSMGLPDINGLNTCR